MKTIIAQCGSTRFLVDIGKKDNKGLDLGEIQNENGKKLVEGSISSLLGKLPWQPYNEDDNKNES